MSHQLSRMSKLTSRSSLRNQCLRKYLNLQSQNRRRPLMSSWLKLTRARARKRWQRRAWNSWRKDLGRVQSKLNSHRSNHRNKQLNSLAISLACLDDPPISFYLSEFLSIIQNYNKWCKSNRGKWEKMGLTVRHIPHSFWLTWSTLEIL